MSKDRSTLRWIAPLAALLVFGAVVAVLHHELKQLHIRSVFQHLHSIQRLNILAANGSQLRATTWGDTLAVLRRDDGVVLASEPYDDDPDWQEIPDRHLVVVERSRIDLIPLKGSP